jgi:hypothetical protein
MAHEARHGSDRNGHGAVDRDRLREEISHLETALRYWQARLLHTPGPSDPGTPCDQIQHTIDLLHQELGFKRALAPPYGRPPRWGPSVRRVHSSLPNGRPITSWPA